MPQKDRKKLEQAPGGHGKEKIVGKVKSSFYFSDFKWKDVGYEGIKKEDMVAACPAVNWCSIR